MAMSAAHGGGMLPTNRRKPLLRTFVSLYRGEFAFQGMVDFAVIGMVVLLFLHPPSQGPDALMAEPRRHWVGRNAAGCRNDGSGPNGRSNRAPHVDEARPGSAPPVGQPSPGARPGRKASRRRRPSVEADHFPAGDRQACARQCDAGGDRGDRLPQLARGRPAAPARGACGLPQRPRQRNCRPPQGRRRARSERRLHARTGPADSRRRGERQGRRRRAANRRSRPNIRSPTRCSGAC